MNRIRKILASLLVLCLLAACLTTSTGAVIVEYEFAGASLVLDESIGLRFLVERGKNLALLNSTVVVSDGDGPIGSPLEPVVTTIDATDYLCYEFTGIAPDELGKTFTATLRVGNLDRATTTYAAADYVRNTMGQDPTVDKVLADLLAYGKATEAYTGHASLPADDEALNALIADYADTDTVAATAAASKKRMLYPSGVTAANAPVRFLSVGLNLRENVGILYKFAPAAGKSMTDYTLKVQVEGEEAKSVTAYAYEGGEYVCRFRGLRPNQMETRVTAWFVDGDGKAASAKLEYSVSSYVYACYRDRSTGADAAVLNTLTQALMRYGRRVDRRFNGALDVFNVDAAFAKSGLSMTADASAAFSLGEESYVINGGTAAQPYLVNATTLRALTAADVSGTGYVKWAGYIPKVHMCGNDKAFDGVIPVSKLNDPVYVEMMLPTDAQNYWCDFSMDSTGPRRGGELKWNNRTNGFNMVQIRAQHKNMINMGALYLNYDVDPPALDDTITLCVKNLVMYVHVAGTPANQWIQMSARKVPSADQLVKVKISWSGGNIKLNSYYKNCGDHAEWTLKGSDLRTDAADWKDNANEQYLVHFWDSQTNFSSIGITDPTTVDGVLCTYVAWVKEEAMANKLVGTVGADLRPGLWPENYTDWQNYTDTVNIYKVRDTTVTDKVKYTGAAEPSTDDWGNYTQVNQLVSSRAAALTSSPKVIFCHNVCPAVYDTVIDSNAVQTLLNNVLNGNFVSQN